MSFLYEIEVQAWLTSQSLTDRPAVPRRREQPGCGLEPHRGKRRPLAMNIWATFIRRPIAHAASACRSSHEGLATTRSSSRRARSCAIASLDRIQQILIANRFGEELYRTAFHGANRHRDIGVAADKDNRQAQICPGELPLKIEPASPGQPDVENQAAGKVRGGTIEEFLITRRSRQRSRRRRRGGRKC
jgi:hypothetical protein